MKKEMINHPTHYGGKNNTYECIKVVEAWQLGFHLGNVLKYISRAGKKNLYDHGEKKDVILEDLHKAAWYLNRYIATISPEKQTYNIVPPSQDWETK